MRRKILIALQLLSVFLFIWHAQTSAQWSSWAVPLVLLLLIVVNSIWFTRFVSWVIFAGSFFCFLVLLSAFTLRWRLEPGFAALPFYRAMLMYCVFIYVSLAQIKMFGHPTRAD